MFFESAKSRTTFYFFFLSRLRHDHLPFSKTCKVRVVPKTLTQRDRDTQKRVSNPSDVLKHPALVRCSAKSSTIYHDMYRPTSLW